LTFEIRMIFDSEDDADFFVAGWIESGQDQCGFHTEYKESDDWTKGTPKFLKLVKTFVEETQEEFDARVQAVLDKSK
jgi:hypothetical protein